MIKLLGQIPIDCTVACSGGADSMALLGFLSRRKIKPRVAYFHHGTDFGEKSLHFVTAFCKENALELTTAYISKEKPSNKSPEEFWRDERYAFLDKLGTVVVAHHLDDCVESWIFNSLRGVPHCIPYARNQVIRPLMLNTKQSLVDWCVANDIPWVEDPSNKDTKYTRNLIRHNIVPEALKVNPGLHKTVAKIVQREYRESLAKDK